MTTSTLTRLTASQEARLPEIAREWLDIGLSCEPCDFDRAKDAASRAYAEAGLTPPKLFLLADSPIGCAMMVAMLRNALDPVRAQVRAQVWAQVGDQVRDPVWDQVRAQVWDQVRDQVGTLVWAQVGDQVRAQVWAQVGDQVGDQVRGCHDAGGLSHYAAMEEFGVACVSRLKPLMDLARCCGWWAPYTDVCILQHRHCELHRLPSGALHNERGMAVKYRDGFGVWALNGIRVDEQLVMRPETQTLQQIDGEGNNDIRALRIERYGTPRYLHECGASVIHDTPNDIEGTHEALLRTPTGHTYLWPTCRSGRPCPPLAVPAEVRTCEQARQWLAGNATIRIVGST